MKISCFRISGIEVLGFIIFAGLLSLSMITKNLSETVELSNENNIQGAWRMKSSGAGGATEMTVVKIITDNYFTNASYDLKSKEFIGTSGGAYSTKGNNFSEIIEFFTWDSTKVGTTNNFNYKLTKNQLEFSGDRNGEPFREIWERIDGFNNKTAPLSGAWRIRQRQGDGGMTTMEWGPRKTLKILSNNRFQWIAYNIESKEFMGTGGGTYTTKNGNYVETLEFFSRDGKRVGDQLTFQFEVKGNQWHHKGKSSAGKDIYEIWEKVE